MIPRLVLPLLLSIGFLSAACAEEIKVPLVGQDWQIAFEGPALRTSSLKYPKGSIQFQANARRFNVSLFVENPPETVKPAQGEDNATCRELYWQQSKRNKTIVADSIKLASFPNCETVTYRTQGVVQNQPYIQDHINCYFIHKGKWVDVHASIIEPTAEDTRSLADFATHLVYGPLPPSKVQTEKFHLGKIGTVGLTPPTGWLTGTVLADGTGKEPDRFTLSFYSPSDPNAYCLLTFFSGLRAPTNREELRNAVQESTKAFASASVEGKAVVRELKLKQGLGAVACFTDASLVGKPFQPGNAKALATGIILPKEQVMGVVSMFMEEAEGAEAGQMLRALETLTVE